MEIILILVIVALVITLIENKKKFQAAAQIPTEVPELQEDEIKIEKLPYIKKNLMTKNEWAFYKQLKPIADKMNYTVICKTRVADLIDIQKGLSKSEWQTAFNQINKKHIDFILCKPENLLPVLLIELDDNSHDTEKRKERDEFIEKVLNLTGYKLLRTRGTAELEENIIKALQ